MGLRYRKSVNFGPFRINLSKSGVGYSFGSKYGRVTKRADGNITGNVNLPGTGISYHKNLGNTNRPCQIQSLFKSFLDLFKCIFVLYIILKIIF